MNDKQIILAASKGALSMVYSKGGKRYECSLKIKNPALKLWNLVRDEYLTAKYEHPYTIYSVTEKGRELINGNASN